MTVNRDNSNAEFDACLSISESNLPQGSQTTFNPSSFSVPNGDPSGSSTLTVVVPAGTVGPFSFTVKAGVCDQGQDPNDYATGTGQLIIYQPLSVDQDRQPHLHAALHVDHR